MGIKELMQQIARRAIPEEPADSDKGCEVRPIALLVAEASGALGILVVALVAELAEARSTPRATESVEASEEVPPMTSPPRPRSVAP